MKTIRTITQLTAVFLFAVFVMRCDEDSDPVSLNTVAGSVTFPAFDGTVTVADGAVIYLKLNASEATTQYDRVTIADVAGQYSFEEVPDGTHFIYAVYDSDNVNNPSARMRGAMFSGEGAVIEVAGDVTQPFALTSMGQANAVAVNTFEGGNWFEDWNHSNVDFAFPYDGFNATYTGRFSAFEMYIDFDPADLAASTIIASVDGLSIKTDSPGGRDALYNSDGTFWQDPVTSEYDLGCISGTFGIDDVLDVDRYITYEATSIETYGDGYLARGNMTFNGNIGSVDLFFRFLPGFQAENRSGVLTQFSSFQGEFDFAALNDFGIDSGHVLDSDVTVKVSFQVTQPVE